MDDVKFEKTSKYLRKAYQMWWRKTYDETGLEPTQKEFADFLGVNPSSLNQWMKGSRAPNDSQKYQIFLKLGPGIYYATDTPSPMPDTPELRAVAEFWVFLTEGQKRQIVDMVERFQESNDPKTVSGDPATA